MIVYFGRDDKGYFADSEEGMREYLPEDLWRSLVEAGAHAGADTRGADVPNKTRVKLSLTEQVRVDKFEGDQLIETVNGTPATTIL